MLSKLCRILKSLSSFNFFFHDCSPFIREIIQQKVVGNDHVLAIVKLREEELEREERAQKEQTLMTERQQQLAAVDEADASDSPKLTRAKAKELNQVPQRLMPVTHSEPNEEVAALIHDELHSDDDDEEYQPAEEDFEVCTSEFYTNLLE